MALAAEAQMELEYIPLLNVQRDLCALPRNRARFKEYLHTIFQGDELGMRAPLLAMNPMSKDHVLELLDRFLEFECDTVGAQATLEATPQVKDLPGRFKVTLVVADDLHGGWTNRYANEFEYRFGMWTDHSGTGTEPALPRWLKHFWLFGVLWTSEPPDLLAARTAVLTAIYRAGYIQRHGPARTLAAMMKQEGEVMAQAGCVEPVLEDEDVEYTREILKPFLEETDKRTCMECLFGDAPGRTLGFSPRGLSPWAGLALALHDGNRSKSKIGNLSLRSDS
jgi:hypothetical protein